MAAEVNFLSNNNSSSSEINKNQKIYLSIDLDYWSYHKDPNKSSKLFLKEIAKLNKPIFVVNSHERLIPHIDESKCNCLINIDYHSDLTDGFKKNKYLVTDANNKEIPFTEGTWGNFVCWQNKGTFVWVYPSYKDCVKKEYGLCHCGNNDPFVTKQTNWKQTKRYAFAKNIVSDPKIMKHIEAIGICTSYNWLQPLQFEADYLPQLIGINKSIPPKTIKTIMAKRFDNVVKLKF